MADMIPEYEGQTFLENIRVIRARPTDFGLSALSDLAGNLSAQARADEQQALSLEFAQAKNTARQRAAEFEASSPYDEKQFEQQFGSYAEQAIQGLPEKLRGAAQAEFQRIGVDRYNAILGKAAQRAHTNQGIALQQVANDDMGDYLTAAEAGKAADPMTLQAREAFVAGMNARVAAGYIPQEQAASLIEQADAQARGLTHLAFNKETYRRFGYLAAMKELGDDLGKDENIPLGIREKLLDRGQEWVREQQGLADRADAEARKRQEELEAATAKAGWEREASGELTPNWVKANKDNLPLSEFKALMGATKGDAAHIDDPAVVNDLERRVYAGQDISEDVMLAHRRGSLKNGTMSSLLSRNRDFQRTGGPVTPYERARKYMIDLLDPGPMVNDPAARARKANALKMLDDHIEAAPKDKPRTDTEIWDFAKETVSRFALVDWNEIAVSLPLPKMFVGTRTAPNIEATETALFMAHKEGRISRDELNREARIIEQWRNAIAQRRAREGSTK